MLHSAMNNGRTFGPRRWLHTDPALTETMGEHRMADTSYKTCSRCMVAKPVADFWRHKDGAGGIHPACKDCCNALRNTRRAAERDVIREREKIYYEANKERIHANNRASRERHAEKVRASKKAYYDRVKTDPQWQAREQAKREAKREAKRAYDREYHKRDPQRAIERAAEWQRTNRDRRAAITRNYDARRRAHTEGGITTADLAAWVSEQKKSCYWCGCKCPKGFHVDHYVPLSKGGAHEAHNLVIACGPCNLKKNAKDPLDFARAVGRLF